MADLDGDGLPDVVWGSYDVVALNGATGTLEWRGPNSSRVWPGIAIADLTGNGTLEVIVGRSGDQVTVYDRLGNVVWTRNPFGFGEVRTLAVNTATMGVTRNRVGTARFTHDGPPGAFIAEAAIGNFALSRPYIQPVKFAAVREAR